MRPHSRPLHDETDPDHAASGDMRVDDGDRVYIGSGDVIANKYRVDRVLGSGGVGFVVAAKHMELGGFFALKFLKRRFLNDATIVERFTREAKAACWIQNEYSARVYDVGSHQGSPFIVMEYLVGRDLGAVLSERGALAVTEATEYALQACAALAVAHANGIVHRDIKPENLFLIDQNGLPTIKLLDFGISKFALTPERPADEWAMAGEPITGTLTCGTPFYMSPEQIRSTATVDARSDVWSLGMVLYELLASVPAFQAESVADVCAAILAEEPRSLCEVRPEVPGRLADVISRCLQKDPADRFPNVAELAIALLPFAPPRALAIAEGSSWIRSAAIQTLGNSSGEGRVSASHTALPSRSQPDLSKRPTLAAAPETAPRRWIAISFGALLVLSLASFVSFRRVAARSADPSPSARPPIATEPAIVAAIAPVIAPSAPSPSVLPAPPIAVEPRADSPKPPAARPHPVPRVVRSPPPPKTSATGATAPPPVEPPTATATQAPPVAPGAPDLGY